MTVHRRKAHEYNHYLWCDNHHSIVINSGILQPDKRKRHLVCFVVYFRVYHKRGIFDNVLVRYCRRGFARQPYIVPWFGIPAVMYIHDNNECMQGQLP